MADLTCKLLVIGAGPGGYVCAIRAAQHGVDTILAGIWRWVGPVRTSAAFHRKH